MKVFAATLLTYMRIHLHHIAALGFIALMAGVLVVAAMLFQRQPPTARDEIWASMWEEERNTPIEDTAAIPPPGEFFLEHSDLPLAIGNDEFQKTLGEDGLVLDAREQEEVDIGRFPESLHIRYGDLREGAWRSLPTDKVVYVFCYSGVRGEIVSSFLRERGIVARYLKEGAVDWVEAGGRWDGEIDFYGVYTDRRYRSFLPEQEWNRARREGAVLVDARGRHKFDRGHVAGSINIPMEYTPTRRLEPLLNSVPSGRPVVTLCDDLSSCFDATVAGMRLEKRGHPFIGLYDLRRSPVPLFGG